MSLGSSSPSMVVLDHNRTQSSKFKDVVVTHSTLPSQS